MNLLLILTSMIYRICKSLKSSKILQSLFSFLILKGLETIIEFLREDGRLIEDSLIVLGHMPGKVGNTFLVKYKNLLPFWISGDYTKLSDM